MNKDDIRLINERYVGQWEVHPKNMINIQPGKYVGRYGGYVLTVDGHSIELEEGIRGINVKHNVEITNDGKIMLSYIN